MVTVGQFVVGAVAAAAVAGALVGCDREATPVPGAAVPVGGTSSATPGPSSAGSPAVTPVGGSPGTPAATPGPTATEPTAVTLSGEQYAYVTAVDPAARTVTVDVVQYFVGRAAVAACAQDGKTGGGSPSCATYYVRNTNPLKRTLPVTAGARITVLVVRQTGFVAERGTLGQVRAGLSNVQLYKLTVSGGAVTVMQPIRLP